MNLVLLILGVIGILLSVYALQVERKHSTKKGYRAACDMGERVSCTKAFSSKYGKILGLSNSFYGIIFYLVILIFSFFELYNYVFYLSFLAFVGTIYLAYVLYFKLRGLCIVCTAIYILNLILLIYSYTLVY